MRRAMIIVVGLLAVLTGLAGPLRAQPMNHIIEGTEDDKKNNVWKYNSEVSPPAAALNDPAKRLRVPVANGDTVTFRVTGTRKHGVIFENAKQEVGKVWSVKTGPEDLSDIDDSFKGLDKTHAQATKPVQTGDIITITIDGLKPGDANGILFACNPHSKKGGDPKNPDNREMLGVIVLKDK